MKIRYFEVCFLLHLCQEIISVQHGDNHEKVPGIQFDFCIITESPMAFKCGEMAQYGDNQQLRSAITASDRAIASSLKAITATIITGKDHKKHVFPDDFLSGICSAVS